MREGYYITGRFFPSLRQAMKSIRHFNNSALHTIHYFAGAPKKAICALHQNNRLILSKMTPEQIDLTVRALGIGIEVQCTDESALAIAA